MIKAFKTDLFLVILSKQIWNRNFIFIEKYLKHQNFNRFKYF